MYIGPKISKLVSPNEQGLETVIVFKAAIENGKGKTAFEGNTYLLRIDFIYCAKHINENDKVLIKPFFHPFTAFRFLLFSIMY